MNVTQKCGSTSLVIAVDGPAASGKSTVAKLVAAKLGMLYIDTGAMYRAVTLAALETLDPSLSKANYTDELTESFVSSLLPTLNIEFDTGTKNVLLNDRDVSKAIRNNLISKHVSVVASYKAVRDRLVALQREIAHGQSVIMDGRDIGTVVFPNAGLKVFMVASARVRAERRLRELHSRGDNISLDSLVEEIEERDRLDSTRKEGPLIKAGDAVELNTDELNINQVVNKILDLLK